jgi:hypothetical protein
MFITTSQITEPAKSSYRALARAVLIQSVRLELEMRAVDPRTHLIDRSFPHILAHHEQYQGIRSRRIRAS